MRKGSDKVPLPRIQVAMQGGGARLVTLLGAAAALQELQDARRLVVTRAAGTSAGAIAAALLASGVRLQDVLEYVRRHKKELKRNLPRVTLRNPRALYLLLTKGRLSSTEVIARYLAKVIDRNATIGSCNETKLLVMSTDLRAGKGHLHSDSDNLIDSVVSSCAIPFVLRGFPVKSERVWHVDGGLCENLPVDPLIQAERDHGKAYAISFGEDGDGGRFNTLLSLLQGVINAAVRHSVARAKERLREGDRVLELSTEIGTFDFEKALKDFEYEFEQGRKSAQGFFERAAAEADLVTSRPPDDLTARDLGRLYRTCFERVPYEIEAIEIVVQARSLRARTEADFHRVRDHIEYSARFQPLDGTPVTALALPLLGMPDEARPLARKDIRLFDSAGTQLEFLDFKVAYDDNSPAYLVFPKEELWRERSPYRIVLSHEVAGLVAPLWRGQEDTMGVRTTRAHSTVKQVRIVLQIPDGMELEWAPAQGNAGGTVPEIYRSKSNPSPPAGYHNEVISVARVPPRAVVRYRVWQRSAEAQVEEAKA